MLQVSGMVLLVTEPTPESVAALRALAEAAGDHEGLCPSKRDNLTQCPGCKGERGLADNPQVILALCDDWVGLRAEIERLKGVLASRGWNVAT